MTKKPVRFTGTLAQLKQVVGLTGIAGRWQRMPARYWRFLCENGAILNWWPTTHTFNFQGPAAAKAAFERAIIEVANGTAGKTPRLPQPGKE